MFHHLSGHNPTKMHTHFIQPLNIVNHSLIKHFCEFLCVFFSNENRALTDTCWTDQRRCISCSYSLTQDFLLLQLQSQTYSRLLQILTTVFLSFPGVHNYIWVILPKTGPKRVPRHFPNEIKIKSNMKLFKLPLYFWCNVFGEIREMPQWVNDHYFLCCEPFFGKISATFSWPPFVTWLWEG